jgi:hypothetical protein
MAEPQSDLPTGDYITIGLLIALAALLSWLIASYPGNPSQRSGAGDCESIAQQYSQPNREGETTGNHPTGFQNDKAAPDNATANQTKDNIDNERQIAKYNCQLAIYTRDLAYFTKWLVYATTGLIMIGLLQGFFLQRSVRVADRAATEAKDAIVAAQAGAYAATTHALAAEEANKINRDLLIATQRPWISVDLTPANDLIYRDDGAYLQITCTMKNVGNTPALYVWPRLCGILQGSQNAAARQQALIVEARQENPIGRDLGHAIFPGEPQRVSVLTAILIRNDGVARFQPVGADRTILQIAVVGFVSYKTTFDQIWRYTGLSYALYRTDFEGITGVGVHPTFYKDAGNIAAKDLTLRPWFVDGDCFFAT